MISAQHRHHTSNNSSNGALLSVNVECFKLKLNHPKQNEIRMVYVSCKCNANVFRLQQNRTNSLTIDLLCTLSFFFRAFTEISVVGPGVFFLTLAHLIYILLFILLFCTHLCRMFSHFYFLKQ